MNTLLSKSCTNKFCLTLFVLFGIFTLQAQEVLTLEKALRFAETNSPDIKRSLLNLERYQQNLVAQRAALKSRFSFDISPVNYSNTRRFDNRYSQWYTNETFSSDASFRVEQPILVTDGTISLINRFGWQNSNSTFQNNLSKNKAFTNNLYLNLKQPVFTYNKLKMKLKELELNYENANISYAIQRLNLEKSVTQYFFNVYMAQMNKSIAKDELANTQKSYDIIKNKVEAGLAAKEELYQAELNLATAKSTLQNREVDYENAKDRLKLNIGMDLMEDVMVLADVAANPVPVDLQKAIAHGLSSRMELRQREIDIESSQFELIRTKALNEFRGDINLTFGIIGDNEKLNQVYDNPTKNPQVALSFNIPLFDWGEKKARIKAQEATIKTQELSLDDEKNQIIISIRQVYRSLKNQLNQIEIARQNEKNAQLTYEINLERYENGDLTGMDLNLYQTQLSEKKIAYYQSLINYKIELLNLKIQTLYDFIKGEAILPGELYIGHN
ncbi:putative outer membrane lipoprotein silC precursor [hydrothermal vent metagenome]|uniref:Putative outer membrane lipoprotein silC n=1 Tax=hydrothermal vent metagenome TaxID=652676 RepID=A0A3B0TTQ1_9ZZZZ